ncbi:MAG: fructosamine kinase family protein [Actinomycetota bacterium]|nr:fructosamine kinase family protein [Actinomycetota bacterium]
MGALEAERLELDGLAAAAGTSVLSVVGAGRSRRVRLGDGREAFAKVWAHAPQDFFQAEARGLAWLAGTGAVDVPDVLSYSRGGILMAWIAEVGPSPAAAEALGRGLARMHSCGAAAFGAEWPGFVGTLPLDNRLRDLWPAFYAEARLAPYLELARSRGAISGRGAALVEQVMSRLEQLGGPPEPPSRLHGDLWSGNVMWGAPGSAWLVDPAAHGGHRETDLAMLALFGTPYLDRIVAAYDEVAPLAAGWQRRVPLHQLHPLLVHAALFGSSYGMQAERAAAAALAG